MPRLIEIPLTLPQGENLHECIGSCLHGVLMEIVDNNIADLLHSQGLRPYIQSLIYDKYQPIWRLGVLMPEIEDAIFDGILKNKNIFIKNRGFSITLGTPLIRRSESYNKLINEISNAPVPNGARFDFLTTTSFKSNNNYLIWPDLRLIWQSIIKKWNTFSYQSLEDGMAFALVQFTEIQEYDLRSKHFSVSGHQIPGFYGKIKISFKGNQQANSLLGMLTKFATFSGVGIKNALGMGATSTQLLFP